MLNTLGGLRRHSGLSFGVGEGKGVILGMYRTFWEWGAAWILGTTCAAVIVMGEIWSGGLGAGAAKRFWVCASETALGEKVPLAEMERPA